MPKNWTREEVEVIVSDYFDMLVAELSDKRINKAEHSREVRKLITRTKSSIEFKHENISAVLAQNGLPFIRGYKPLPNYQKSLLPAAVFDYIRRHPEIETYFQQFAEAVPIIATKIVSFSKFEEDAPERQLISASEVEVVYRTPIKVSYIENEQSNKAIGNTGEKLVLEYERWRLINAGKESLADQIEWVADTQGDGLGFDILSKNVNGTDRYIEVKSTKLTKEAPFYFSQNELLFSREKKSNYHLYRVFNLKEDPKVFVLDGSFDEFCNFSPVKFKGFF